MDEQAQTQAETQTAQTEEKTTERTFTQAEVNSFVEERLKRERGKFADYDALREKATKFEELEAEKLTAIEKAEKKIQELTTYKDKAMQLESIIAEYEAADEARLKAVLKDIPKEYHDLIPEGSNRARLAWIESAREKGLLTPPQTQRQASGLDAGKGTRQATKSEFDEAEIRRKFRLNK